jgi:hypothetical protein
METFSTIEKNLMNTKYSKRLSKLSTQCFSLFEGFFKIKLLKNDDYMKNVYVYLYIIV